MKQKLISIAASLFLASCGTTANANDASTEDLDHCYYLAEFAEVIMEYRQKGVPMTIQMKTVPQEGYKGRVLRAMVEDAYNQPFWSTPENKQRAVTEFTDDVFRLCIKATNEK